MTSTAFMDACAKQQEAIDSQTRNDITSRAYREFNANKLKEKAVNKEFQVHILNDSGIVKANNLAAEFDNLLNVLKGMCPESREFSIVKTKLEEACFFAKKSIANDPSNQKAS